MKYVSNPNQGLDKCLSVASSKILAGSIQEWESEN